MTNDKAIKWLKVEASYIEEDVGNGKEILEAYDMAIEALEQTRWIPCSERLPEEYIHVLCQFTLGGMGECYLAHGLFHIVGGLVMTCNEVIAWMPLPEPYQAESEVQNADSN